MGELFYPWLKCVAGERLPPLLPGSRAKEVAPGTQNVAVQSIFFPYQEVRGIELSGINDWHAQKDKRLTGVLTKVEVRLVDAGTDQRTHLSAGRLNYFMERAYACTSRTLTLTKTILSIGMLKATKIEYTLLP